MKNYCSHVFLPILFFWQPLFGQTPEIGIIRGPITHQDPIPISVEQADAMRLESVTPEVRPIRERQLVAARSQAVDLVFRDEGFISKTGIRGVPLSLSGIPIQSDDQIVAVVGMLYPLLGFERNEQLVFRGASGIGYSFAQTINGMHVDKSVIYIALAPDRTVLAIRGNAILNRDFRVDHSMDAEEAMESVDRYLEGQGYSSQSKERDEDHVHLVYKQDDARTLTPWWHVEKAGFYVDPNGTVSSAVTVTP